MSWKNGIEFKGMYSLGKIYFGLNDEITKYDSFKLLP